MGENSSESVWIYLGKCRCKSTICVCHICLHICHRVIQCESRPFDPAFPHRPICPIYGDRTGAGPRECRLSDGNGPVVGTGGRSRSWRWEGDSFRAVSRNKNIKKHWGSGNGKMQIAKIFLTPPEVKILQSTLLGLPSFSQGQIPLQVTVGKMYVFKYPATMSLI